jgi:hypothetical protein
VILNWIFLRKLSNSSGVYSSEDPVLYLELVVQVTGCANPVNPKPHIHVCKCAFAIMSLATLLVNSCLGNNRSRGEKNKVKTS